MNTNESFIAHLIELRTRLMRAAVSLLLVFIGLFPWASDLYAMLAKPLLAKLPKGGQMIATDVTTPFLVPLKVALMAAFLIALPYILYQVWRFIAPGLHAHEKRWAFPVVASSMVLFFEAWRCIFCCISGGIRFYHCCRTAGCGGNDRYR